MGRLDGHPLGHEHAKGRQHHGQDADDGDERRAGHAGEQAAHVLDVAGADLLLDGPDAQEHERLGDGVEQDQQDGRGDGGRGVDAGAGDNERQVGDGGVGQNLLAVGLAGGQAGRGQKHEGPEKGHEVAEVGAGVDRGQAHDDVDAGLDHGRGVEQGRDRGGRDHGPGEPALERGLGGLGHAGEDQQEHGHQDGAAGHGEFRSASQDLLERQGAGDLVQEHDAKQEGRAAEHVHPQGAFRVFAGDLGVVMADEHERAQRGAFPEEIHPQHVVGQDQAVHGAQEQDDEEEKLRLFRRGQMQMFLVFLHVADAVHGDEGTDDGHHQHHDEAEVVREKGRRRSVVLDHEEVEPNKADDLGHGEPYDDLVFALQADQQHHGEDQEVTKGDQ